MQAPFPEEMNRVIVGRLAALHFAATEKAKRNLLAEGVPKQAITVTGNTGIDALLQVEGMLRRGTVESGRSWRELDPSRRLILVTAHRRESFGAGVEQICAALTQIAGMREVQIVYPVHPNPNVSGTVREKLSGVANILLLEPLDYVAFVDLMARSYLLLTDSGGVQEEGPSLGKPVLVMRSVTERPEAVEAGTAVLTGHDTTTIVEAVAKLLEDRAEYDRRSRIHNPYGDGQASQRIADRVKDFLD
jgi:UDP-N-acetylglucosamine 2-epimerase (non-hydrolysing)